MEVLFIILLIFFVAGYFFKPSSNSVYTPPSKDNMSLRNMQDVTGRFYVSRFHAPHSQGDYWEAQGDIITRKVMPYHTSHLKVVKIYAFLAKKYPRLNKIE